MRVNGRKWFKYEVFTRNNTVELECALTRVLCGSKKASFLKFPELCNNAL